MPNLKDATDAELAARYARVDLQIRQITEPSRLMDKLDELLWEIREEQARRKETAK